MVKYTTMTYNMLDPLIPKKPHLPVALNYPDLSRFTLINRKF